MAGSTINGNAGAAANGALVYAQQIDGRDPIGYSGAPIGVPQPAVVGANGAYSFTNLVAGTYKLTIVPRQTNPSGAVQPNNAATVLTQDVITVDGSTTYAI